MVTTHSLGVTSIAKSSRDLNIHSGQSAQLTQTSTGPQISHHQVATVHPITHRWIFSWSDQLEKTKAKLLKYLEKIRIGERQIKCQVLNTKFAISHGPSTAGTNCIRMQALVSVTIVLHIVTLCFLLSLWLHKDCIYFSQAHLYRRKIRADDITKWTDGFTSANNQD